MTPRPDARRRGHITTDRWTADEWATVERLTAAARRGAVLGHSDLVDALHDEATRYRGALKALLLRDDLPGASRRMIELALGCGE